MDQDSPTVVNPNTQQQPPLPSDASSFRKIILGIVIGVVVTLVAGGIGVYYFLSSQEADLNEGNEANESSVETPEKESMENTLETFSDPNIEGMEFEYDPEYWEVEHLTNESSKDNMRGVVLQEKVGNGELFFEYTLPFGVGGGFYTFTEENKPTKVSDVPLLYRFYFKYHIDDNNSYGYGILLESTERKSIVFYENDQSSLNEDLEHCRKAREGETPFLIFSEEECEMIESGEIVGYLVQPDFTRSIVLELLSSLGSIDESWMNDEYIRETGLDDGTIIIKSSYDGLNPEEADKIVEQIAESSIL